MTWRHTFSKANHEEFRALKNHRNTKQRRQKMKSAAGRAHERRRKDEQEERYGREAELAEPWVAGSHVGDGDGAAREVHLQWVDT